MPVSENVEKPRLADRTEAILRSDRSALHKSRRREPAVLLTLVPDIGPVIDFMDAYVPDVADAAGLEYVRLVAPELRELPVNMLSRTFLLLADLTGPDGQVGALVSQALADGRRVLLAVQDPGRVPSELAAVPHVLYGLDAGQFDALLRAIKNAAFSTMEDCASFA